MMMVFSWACVDWSNERKEASFYPLSTKARAFTCPKITSTVTMHIALGHFHASQRQQQVIDIIHMYIRVHASDISLPRVRVHKYYKKNQSVQHVAWKVCLVHKNPYLILPHCWHAWRPVGTHWRAIMVGSRDGIMHHYCTWHFQTAAAQ